MVRNLQSDIFVPLERYVSSHMRSALYLHTLSANVWLFLVPSPFQWVKHIQPDIFVLLEHSFDASSPLLLPRVRESFDHFAVMMRAHDYFCTALADESSPSTLSGGGTSSGVPLEEVRDEAGEVGEEEKGREDAKKEDVSLQGFRIGLPESSLRKVLSIQSEHVPQFTRQLHRAHMIMMDRFLFLRTILNIVATEGECRFIQPQSHEYWTSSLISHGLFCSPISSLMFNKLEHQCQGYPKQCMQLRPVEGGVILRVWGLDVTSVTLWTSQNLLGS